MYNLHLLKIITFLQRRLMFAVLIYDFILQPENVAESKFPYEIIAKEWNEMSDEKSERTRTHTHTQTKYAECQMEWPRCWQLRFLAEKEFKRVRKASSSEN